MGWSLVFKNIKMMILKQFLLVFSVICIPNEEFQMLVSSSKLEYLRALSWIRLIKVKHIKLKIYKIKK